MTNKQIAERLRVLADAPTLSIENRGELDRMANELDPPRPEPDIAVWWRYKYAGGPEYKYFGIVEDHGEGIYDAGGCFRAMQDIEYKPARILGPNEVAVGVQPVSEWPESWVGIRWTPAYKTEVSNRIFITRTEAMEAER